MSAVPTPITSIDERLWDEFLALKEQAMASGNLEDALACKRAWSAFLNGERKSGVVLAFEARR